MYGLWPGRHVIYITDIEEMPDDSGAARAEGSLQVVYWQQGGGGGAEEHPRKYVYKENLTRDEALEESGKLNRSLNSPY